jgi:hypothetical protein
LEAAVEKEGLDGTEDYLRVRMTLYKSLLRHVRGIAISFAQEELKELTEKRLPVDETDEDPKE